MKTLEGQSKEGKWISYNTFDENKKNKIHLTVETVYVLKQLLEMPLLDNAGSLKDDYKRMIEESRKCLQSERT